MIKARQYQRPKNYDGPDIYRVHGNSSSHFIILQGISPKHEVDGVRLLLVLRRVAISDRQCVANSDITQQ
jgi:hypothetical protein